MATPIVNVSNKTTPFLANIPKNAWARYSLVAGRVFLGFVFLWAFLDKTFGFNYTTKPANSWLNGGSPTKGFLGNSKSWFADSFHAIAGNVFVDWLFMLALLGIGLALLLGIGMRVAAGSGVLLMVLMYLAAVPGVPAITNPVMDDHLIYATLFIALVLVQAGNTLGLGRWWSSLSLVRKYPFLA